MSNNTILTRSASFTRPADTTAYAVSDVVSDSTSAPKFMVFPGIGQSVGNTGSIIKAQLYTDQTTCVAQFRLWLFETDPTAINDNSPFTLLYADIGKHCGFIDFAAATTEGTGSTSAYSQWTTGLVYKSEVLDANLYGILTTKTIFTPASGQKFTVALTVNNG